MGGSSRFWRHFFGSEEETNNGGLDAIETAKFKDLEQQLNRLNKLKERAAEESCINDEKLVKGREIRERMAKIRIRDKARRILVIPVDEIKSNLAHSLLALNPSARVTFAESLEHARGLFAENTYEMVYLVLQFGTPSCYGPCFVSMNNDLDKERRKIIGGVIANVRGLVKEFEVEEELIIVCGTPELDCPLADRIYAEPGKSGIFNV